jgi:hypothetical protein
MAGILVKCVAKDSQPSTEIRENFEEEIRQSKDRGSCASLPNENHKIKLVGSSFTEATGLPSEPSVFFDRMPVLIIDEMNNAGIENESFIQDIFQAASKLHVCVFIVTRVKETATKAVSWNGGSKIKSLACGRRFCCGICRVEQPKLVKGGACLLCKGFFPEANSSGLDGW